VARPIYPAERHLPHGKTRSPEQEETNLEDLERADEINGRLAEMEIALGKMTPGSRAVVYLGRELQDLLEEASRHQARWEAVVRRAEKLDQRLKR
jgi:hypothetical protein